MSHTASPWTFSTTIQNRLATDESQPPPRQDDAFAYIDACFTNISYREQRAKIDLVAKLGAEEQQRQMLESRMDLKLLRAEDPFEKEVTEQGSKIAAKLMDGFRDIIGVRFDQINDRLNDQETIWTDRLDGMATLLLDARSAHDNAEALFRNGLIRRLHEKIIPLLVRKPCKKDVRDFEWGCHPSMPKTAMDVYTLAQRAKGILVNTRDRRGLAANPEYEHHVQEQARAYIKSLCVFYQVDPREEHFSETDALEVWLDENSVDQHMTELLERWGMRWDKVCKLGDLAGKPQPSQAGRKRSETAGSGKEAKKARDSSSSD